MSLRAITAAAAARGRSLTFIASDGVSTETRRWDELLHAARRRAHALQQQGLAPGDRAAVMGETGAPMVETLLAINLSGAIPIVLPLPAMGRAEAHGGFVEGVLRETGARMVLTGASVGYTHQTLGQPIPTATPDGPAAEDRAEHAVAFLQFSSGSTRAPRGVKVMQACLRSNLEQIRAGVSITDSDVVVSWLPLYHDMGLVAGLFGGPAWGLDAVLMDPMTFIRRPSRWLKAISRFSGSISMAPNFAYEYCLRFVRDRELEGLDLSTWRVAWNGAEMVLPSTVTRFARRFAACGLAEDTILPCYGAAESTLKVTSRGEGEGMKTLTLERAALARGRAVKAKDGHGVVEIVSVGRPHSDTSVRVVDRDGMALPEGAVGEIEVRGPSVCPGYVGAGDDALDGGRWLSGDLGFILEGELYITGRKKDVIVVDGRNVYAFDVEWAVREVAGAKLRRVAAFGVDDLGSGSERVVVAVEPSGRRRPSDEVLAEIEQAISEAAGTTRVEVVVLDRVPVTTSGKVRRGSARTVYQDLARGSGPTSARL